MPDEEGLTVTASRKDGKPPSEYAGHLGMLGTSAGSLVDTAINRGSITVIVSDVVSTRLEA